MKILAVDDEPSMLTLLDQVLVTWGHTVVTASDAQSGIALLATDIELVITDRKMPTAEGGKRMLIGAKASNPLLPVIVTSGDFFLEPEARGYFLTLGADAVLDKPYKISELKATIEHVTVTLQHVFDLVAIASKIPDLQSHGNIFADQYAKVAAELNRTAIEELGIPAEVMLSKGSSRLGARTRALYVEMRRIVEVFTAGK